MKELGGGAMPPRIFGLEAKDSTVNNIGQLPCASASVLRYTASVLASVSEATVSVLASVSNPAALVLVSVSASTALVTTLN